MIQGLGLRLDKNNFFASPYGPNLLPEGDFSTGNLTNFDEVGAQYSVNGSNQLVCDNIGTNEFLGKNFAYDFNDMYLISYDVLSEDLDGGVSFSGASMFSSTVLPFTVGHHDIIKTALNPTSTMAFRLVVLATNTSGTQIVMDNFKIRKIL